MLTTNMKRLTVTGYMGQLWFAGPATATSGLPRC
jgi:hypothetical protein